MKAIISFALMLLFFNTATADDTYASIRCDDIKVSSPAQSALITLSMNGYLTQKEVEEHERRALERRRSEHLSLETIGFKTVARPIPYYEELVPPLGSMPFDTPNPQDNLYQIVQHLKFKNAAGKVFEFVIIGNVSEHDCGISRPMIIETSPRHRIVGNWEDYLQTWERIKLKEKEVFPNVNVDSGEIKGYSW